MFYSSIDFNCIYCFILTANPFGFASDEAAVTKSGYRLNLNLTQSEVICTKIYITSFARRARHCFCILHLII